MCHQYQWFKKDVCVQYACVLKDFRLHESVSFTLKHISDSQSGRRTSLRRRWGLNYYHHFISCFCNSMDLLMGQFYLDALANEAKPDKMKWFRRFNLHSISQLPFLFHMRLHLANTLYCLLGVTGSKTGHIIKKPSRLIHGLPFLLSLSSCSFDIALLLWFSTGIWKLPGSYSTSKSTFEPCKLVFPKSAVEIPQGNATTSLRGWQMVNRIGNLKISFLHELVISLQSPLCIFCLALIRALRTIEVRTKKRNKTEGTALLWSSVLLVPGCQGESIYST